MAVPKVTFRSEDPPMSFVCWLDEEGTKPTGGYGGWNIVDRPRRLGITQWDGRQPLSMDVAILIDGFARSDSVEVECKILEKMAFSGDGVGEEPPVITVKGAFVQHDQQKWVIAGISWGNAMRRVKDGDRVRQQAVVGLIRYNAADKAQLGAASRTRKNAGKKGSRHG